MTHDIQDAVARLRAFRTTCADDHVVHAASGLTAAHLDTILKALAEHDGPLEVPGMHI